jgi:hypothetical protein
MASPAHNAGALLDATRASIFGPLSAHFAQLVSAFPSRAFKQQVLLADDTKLVGQGSRVHHDTSLDATC